MTQTGKDNRQAANDELLTVAEVAALDKCSEKTVRRAIESGLLAAVRIGPGRRALRIRKVAHAAYRRGEFHG